MKEIKNKELRKRLDSLGLSNVHLIKGDGYFYIISDTDILKEDSIYLNSFYHQSISDWVRDIQQLINV